MASLQDQSVRELLEAPNYAIVSTINPDGSISSAVIWADIEDGAVAINSARGRKWPTNLERNPTANVLIYESGNPYNYVEIRGQATATTEGADEHIDRLSKKYIGKDEYPYRQPDEERIKFTIQPDVVRHVRQG